MPKTTREKLVKDCRNELTTHLKSGTINVRKLSYNLSDLQIEDFEELKKAHFVLWEEVSKFVEELEPELRQINTETKKEYVETRGEIRGSISWSDTIKNRYSKNYGDKSVFVCKNPYVEYDTPENLVLKKLLGIIYTTVDQFESPDYTQEETKQRWPESLIERFQRLFNTNIYIERIEDYEKISLTPRDLEAARTSRKELYREAHRLYRAYEKLNNSDFEDGNVQEILNNTLIEPQYTYTLFELYAVFGVVKKYEKDYEDLKLRTMRSDKGRDPVAILENSEKTVEVYHDSTGKDLKFYENALDLSEVTGDDEGAKFLRKYIKVIERHRKAVDAFIDKSENNSLYSGRPDIIIIEKSEEQLKKVVIGEVKYTASKNTFSQGLKELLEYVEFGRTSSNYLENLNIELEGIIITDNMSQNVKKTQGVKWMTSKDLKIEDPN